VTATLLATRAPVLLAPAMHTEMWEHPSVTDNVATLRARGVHIVDPEEGRLAGGDVGAGRLADPVRIVAAAASVMARDGDLAGRRIVITAGGTREPIDPVRFIGNRSSGKMGYAIADAAAARGAAVTMIATVARAAHPRVEVQLVETAEEMAAATLAAAPSADVIVMAAAVADFRPKVAADAKLKKADGVPEITLEPTPDILKLLGEQKRPDQFLVGFAAETDDVRQNAAAKLSAKRVDLMVGNDVRSEDSGFEVDTNRAVLLDAFGAVDEVGLLTKAALADAILDRVRDARPRHPSPAGEGFGSGDGSERQRANHGEGATS
jgi:phosphopantothenoylcysteine decarboxylase/phosphopantothenate--cysteine ligase